MTERENKFIEKAYIITENEYTELENEWNNEPDYNEYTFDVTISGIIMNFDGLETSEEFENYLNVYENTAYKIIDENDNEIGFAFHSIV